MRGLRAQGSGVSFSPCGGDGRHGSCSGSRRRPSSTSGRRRCARCRRRPNGSPARRTVSDDSNRHRRRSRRPSPRWHRGRAYRCRRRDAARCRPRPEPAPGKRGEGPRGLGTVGTVGSAAEGIPQTGTECEGGGQIGRPQFLPRADQSMSLQPRQQALDRGQFVVAGVPLPVPAEGSFVERVEELLDQDEIYDAITHDTTVPRSRC